MSRARLALAYSAFVFAGVTAWAAPQLASACSCFPELNLDWPQEGGQMAANDLIRLSDSCAGVVLEEIDVFVDGEPAELATTDRGPLSGYEIVPTPEPGAAVQLVACPGYGSCEELEDADWDTSDAIVEYSFTVGEADEDAPPAPLLDRAGFELVEVDLHGECGGEVTETRSVQEWTLELDRDLDATSQMIAYVISIAPADGTEPTIEHRYVQRDANDLDLDVRRYFDVSEAGQDVCATVHAVDMAGHESDTVTQCQYLDDSEVAPPDPELDGDHIPVPDSSCACTNQRGSGGAMGMMLALLGLLGLRRTRGS